MKNIHLLKTTNTSKILKDLVDKTYQFKKEATFGNRIELPLNIYITNDEEIKEGDWYLNGNGCYKCNNSFAGTTEMKFGNPLLQFNKKIILTTDQDLIKDGVQAIDDELLEWFVKNPSCENVEVKSFKSYSKDNYIMFIPKEEPNPFELPKALPDDVFFKSLEEPKQETLEEVAEKRFPSKMEMYEVFIEGAKWQQEQDKKMYSEEDMINFAQWFSDYEIPKSELISFTEQFKNK